MSDESKVTETLTMSLFIDPAGNGRQRAAVILAVTGAVVVAERRFECLGLLNADQGKLLSVYARWAFARQILSAVQRDPGDIAATCEAGSWRTRVSWTDPTQMPVTVTVDGFHDFPIAANAAHAVVEELVATMVPADDDPLRQQLVNLPNLPGWFTQVRANHRIFP